jgi:hypothetical protein
VDRILDTREWDAYAKMVDVLKECLLQVSLPIPTGISCVHVCRRCRNAESDVDDVRMHKLVDLRT